MSENVEEKYTMSSLTQAEMDVLAKQIIEDMDEQDRRLEAVKGETTLPPIPSFNRAPSGIDTVDMTFSGNGASVTLVDSVTGEEFWARDEKLWKAWSYACLVAEKYGNREMIVCKHSSVKTASFLARYALDLAL